MKLCMERKKRHRWRDKMEKMKMQTENIADKNYEMLSKMFPNAITETVDAEGNVVRAIDADVLRQEMSCSVVEGKDERYQFTWPDKKKTILSSNAPISSTLRPVKEESINFDTTKNLYIEGDNLDVLKLLQETYLNSIKMIYIDPPYNTGSDFVYEDDFAENVSDYVARSGQYDELGNRLVQNTNNNGRYHTDWLNMMFARLKLSRNLLSEDGVIFISIDDNELVNMSKLCDEVFGEDNFVALLSVENNPKGRKNSRFISVSNDYCLIYAKNAEIAYFIENVPKNVKDLAQDEDGNYVHNSGKRVLVGENGFNKVVTDVSSDKHYSVYYNSANKDMVIKKEKLIDETNDELISKGYERYYSYNGDAFVENTYTIDKIRELFKEGKLDFKNGKIYEKNMSTTIRLKSMLVNKSYQAVVGNEVKEFSMDFKTTSAGTALKELFGTKEVVFSAPKNVSFIRTLATLIPGDNFTVLDFFSGSATTAHGIMKLNAEEGGRRKYILVQIPEPCEEKSEAYKNGLRTLCEIGKERIRLAGKKYENMGIDIGFRVLKLDSSNMKDVYYNPAETQQSMFDTYADNIKEDRTAEDLLFQVMLDLGVLLSSKIEETEIAGKKVFNVADGFLMACFDTDVTDATVKEIAKQKPYYAVFRDSGMTDDSVLTNFDQIFASYSPETIRKVL